MPDDMTAQRMPWERGSVPVPDPTLLTTQQLVREIGALQSVIDAKIVGLEKAILALEVLINEKIGCVANKSDERHKGVQLQFHERDTRFDHVISSAMQMAKTTATAIEEKTANLQELHHEKFKSVEKQFEQRDVSLLSTLNATKETFREQNLAASLAIAKSEAATTKQIDQITTLLNSAIDGIESKISDLKDRLTTIEGRTAGQFEQRGETQGSQIQWVGIIGLILGVVVAIGGIFVGLSGGPASSDRRVIIEQPLPDEDLRQQTPLR